MEEENNFLRLVPIFSDLDENTIEQIAKLGRPKTFNKDLPVLLEHDTGSALFVIVKGKVKVTRQSEGREVIITLLNESDFFGEMSILDGLSHSANVIAMEESELFIIQRDKFLNLLQTHPQVSIALLQEFASRLRNTNMKIESFSLADAEGRVATVLIQLANDMGKIKQGMVEIEKLPSQYDLAKMAGTSRETISRTLHIFVRKDFIELGSSKLRILDFEKFKEQYS